MTEDRISTLEDRLVEFAQSEKQKEIEIFKLAISKLIPKCIIIKFLKIKTKEILKMFTEKLYIPYRETPI